MNQSNYHPEWQKNRLKFILEKYNQSFFNNKKILELGAFNGFFGNYFQSIGSDVTIYEGRQENVNSIKSTYPNLKKVYLKNLDTDVWDFGKFDIIINFGLYYHLEHHHKKHLENCIDNSDLMFFETVVYDSFDDEIYFRNETGNDQSLSDIGGTPSTSYVENILESKNTIFKKYSDKSLNGGSHHYDWIDINSKKPNAYSRRFWIIKNK